MNMTAIRLGHPAAGMSDPTSGTAPLARMLVAQARAQLLLFWRLPAVSVTGLVMPVMLFLFFVAPHAHDAWRGNVSVGAYMLASIGAYAVGSVMVFNFGVGVAMDRGQKVDVLMRASPLPGWLHLTARLVCALLFGGVALAVLFGVAAVIGGIQLDAATWADLGVILLLGSIPFVGLGFAIAYLAGPNAAPPIANLAFIGMAFASGMFVPLDQMPDLLRAVAPTLPTYHYAQLAWAAVGAGDGTAFASGVFLVAYALGFLTLAAVGYARETRRRFA